VIEYERLDLAIQSGQDGAADQDQQNAQRCLSPGRLP